MPAPVPDRLGPPPGGSNNVYVYRLAEAPARALIMISPGSDLADAARHLVLKFGAGRVLDCRPHAPALDERPPVADPAPTRQAPRRHRWEKLAVHHYRCTHCGLVKRNRIDPDTNQWFQTFQPPGSSQYRGERVPECQRRERQ